MPRPTTLLSRLCVVAPLRETFILVAVLAALALATPVRADGAVVVRASEAQVNFPRGINFHLDAESAAGIADVQLQLNTPGQRYGAAVRNVHPTFTPGPRVNATWTWARFGAALPPGAEITYRWRITEADGRVTETPQSSIRVEDSRHDWREIADGPITVRWYKGGDSFGRAILAAAQDSTARLRQSQGVELRNPLTIHVYASQAELFDAVPGAPGWIGGISIPEFDTILIGVEPTNLDWGKRALTHEMTHQIIFQMTRDPTLGSRVPTWLNEGLAVVSEGETDAQNHRLLDEAVADDALPTLRTLSAPFNPSSPHLAGVAYAASESAVRYMLDTYGPEKMRSLLLALGDGLSPDQAVQRAYGTSFDRLEDEWRTSLGLKPFDRGQSSKGGQGTTPAAPSRQKQARSGVSGLLWLAVGLGGVMVLLIGAGGWLMQRRLRGRPSGGG